MEQPIKKNKFSYFARSRLRLRPQEIWERDYVTELLLFRHFVPRGRDTFGQRRDRMTPHDPCLGDDLPRSSEENGNATARAIKD